MPEVLPLGGLLIAVVVLLVAIGAWVFAELLSRALEHLPLGLGGWVAGNVRGEVDRIGAWLLRTFDTVTRDAGAFFAAIALWPWHFVYETSRAIAHAVNLGIAGIRYTAATAAGIGPAVAAGVAGLRSYVDQMVTNLLGDIRAARVQAIQVAEAAAAAGAATVLGDAENLYNKAVGYADTLAAGAAADLAGVARRLDNLTAAVGGDVAGLVAQIRNDLATATATAEADSAAALAQATAAAHTIAGAVATTTVGQLDAAAHDLVLGPWEALTTRLRPLEQALDPAVAGLLGLPGVLARDLPVSIPGILAMVVPAVAAVTAEVEDCLAPNCRAVKSLGGLFNALEGLGVAGVLAALAAEAVHDPQGAARELEAAGGWAEGTLRELAGAFLG